MNLKYFVISTDCTGNSHTLNYLYENVNPKNIIIVTTLDRGCDYHKLYSEAWVMVLDPSYSRDQQIESILNFSKNNHYSNIIILGDNDIVEIH